MHIDFYETKLCYPHPMHQNPWWKYGKHASAINDRRSDDHDSGVL